jgi:hypothetical protein
VQSVKDKSFYDLQVSEICEELNRNKKKKRKATTLKDSDKDRLFVEMLNREDEEERWRILLYCAKRGFIALR